MELRTSWLGAQMCVCDTDIALITRADVLMYMLIPVMMSSCYLDGIESYCGVDTAVSVNVTSLPAEKDFETSG